MNKQEQNDYVIANYGSPFISMKEMESACGLTASQIGYIGRKNNIVRGAVFDNLPQEEWKSLNFIGLSQYFVSNRGRIKNKKGCLLKSAPHHQSGYLQIRLVDDNKHKVTKLVHQLVALAFLGKPEENKQIDHIDGNRENADVRNLQYLTQEENIQKTKKRNQVIRYLTENEVREICELLQKGYSYSQITRHNPFYTKGKVEKIRTRKGWCNIGKDYTW